MFSDVSDQNCSVHLVMLKKSRGTHCLCSCRMNRMFSKYIELDSYIITCNKALMMGGDQCMNLKHI